MNKKELLDNILGILKQTKEDKAKLQKIYDFLIEKIYEEEEERIEIPTKHKKLINSIAQSIDAGLVCYINTQTMEVVEIFKELFDTYDFDFDEEDDEFEIDDVAKSLKEDLNKIEGWESSIVINPLESHESFKIMQSFIDKTIPEGNIQEKLIGALNRKRPFANFRNLIDNSDYLQDWYDFKQNYLEEHVYEMFQIEGIK